MSKLCTLFLFLVLLLAACRQTVTPAVMTQAPLSTPTPAATSTVIAEPAVTAEETPPYLDPARPVAERVTDLLTRMTLAEKIGQMTLVENNSIQPPAVTEQFIGGVLSGGGGSPPTNTASAWAEMVAAYQAAARQTWLGIPILYGVDAVHGHGNLRGATIFPHNIGLGATRNPELVMRIAQATAVEMIATGIYWNYAPVLAVPQDIRWGRTYEGFSENSDLVTELGVAYLRGLQGERLADPDTVLATPKHFVGDGGTVWGSSRTGDYQIDQGDMQVDEATLRAIHLPPYQAAVDAGALSIMVSFSSWNGTKMHAQRYLLTDVLKGELGFQGFLVSDWQAIDQITGDYYQAVVTAINAGVDMNMVPYDYGRFISTLTRAVEQGDVPMARIDDAVGRILTAKFELGLFDRPYLERPLPNPDDLALVGSEEHRQLAREAVRQSLVLLKNEDNTLPMAKDTSLIFVAGTAANDIGVQSGGWTIEWQGRAGAITPGTTILEGIEATVADTATLQYNRFGNFDAVTDAAGNPAVADVGIVVVGELPYAEGVGDHGNLTLPDTEQQLIERVRERSQRLVVILLSGRPLIINEALATADAFVAAWLPGTEGQGVTDVLFGDYPFIGRLPYTWPRSMDQLPFDFAHLPTEGCEAPLFPFGYGLDSSSAPVVIPDCP